MKKQIFILINYDFTPTFFYTQKTLLEYLKIHDIRILNKNDEHHDPEFISNIQLELALSSTKHVLLKYPKVNGVQFHLYAC